MTSGTIFASRKLSIRDYLLAIAIFVNGAKGHSAPHLSRDLDCQYKTAFVMAHKIREAMASEANGLKIIRDIWPRLLQSFGGRKALALMVSTR